MKIIEYTDRTIGELCCYWYASVDSNVYSIGTLLRSGSISAIAPNVLRECIQKLRADSVDARFKESGYLADELERRFAHLLIEVV